MAEKKAAPVQQTGSKNRHIFITIGVGLLVILTWMAFRSISQNEFLKTWDDQVYVTENRIIKELNGDNISEIFSFQKDLQKFTKNYHPFTTLSLALNFHFSELNPSAYYKTNLVLHILNTLLVFFLVFRLSGRNYFIGFFAGLWFGIHPMHVESVAWISERKDVLYGLFFLLGLIAYSYYLEKNKLSFLGLAFAAFVCSVLSKAMAVPFPLILVLLDIFYQRKFRLGVFLEKIPFLLVSIIFGILSLKIQSDGAINEFETFSISQRVMHASYGFMMYLVKFVNPSDLSAFYPYPFIDDQGYLPMIFRIAPFLVIGLFGITIWAFFGKSRLSRVFFFSIGFYFLLIALVLQFISVGKAIMADRYTYLPYIGLTLLGGEAVRYLIVNPRTGMRFAGWTLVTFGLVLTTVFFVQTRNRVEVWKNDLSLWSNALDQYPDTRLDFIRDKRARMYINEKQYDNALQDYLILIKNDPANVVALESTGRLYGQHLGNLDQSLVYLEKAYAINPGNPETLKSLGVANGMKGRLEKALDFSLKAYALDPADTILVSNIVKTYQYLGQSEKAREFSQQANSAGKNILR